MKLHVPSEQPLLRSALVLTFMLGFGLAAMVNSKAISLAIMLFIYGVMVSAFYAIMQLNDPKRVPHLSKVEVIHTLTIGVGCGLVFMAYYHQPISYGLLILPAFIMARISGFLFFWVVYWLVKPR